MSFKYFFLVITVIIIEQIPNNVDGMLFKSKKNNSDSKKAFNLGEIKFFKSKKMKTEPKKVQI